MALGTTNISTTLVANTIGLGSNDLGTLCTSSKINKWSKWKPVRYNTLVGITLEQLASTTYGLTIPSYTTLSEIITAINTGITWEYLKPRGSSNSEPYRLGDFRNYEHAAVKPFGNFSCPLIGYNNSPSSTIIASLLTNPDGGTYELGFSDLTSVKDYYFAVYMIRTDGNTNGARLITAENTVGSGNGNVTIPIYGLAQTNYYVYPFICDTKNTDPSIMPTGIVMYGLEGLTRATVTIKGNPLGITLQAAWHDDTTTSNQIDYTVNIYNNSGDSISLQTCYTTLRFANKSFDDVLVSGETQTSRGTLVIPANSSYNFSDNDIAYASDSPYGFKLWFSSITPYSLRVSTMVLEQS